MATVPQSHTFTGGVATSSEMNTYVRDVFDFLQNKPMARLRQTVVQTLTTATFGSITFTTEDFDDDPSGAGAHSTSSATSRYVAVYAGWYECSGVVAFAANATGTRGSRWAVNGTAVNASFVVLPTTAAGSAHVPAATVEVYLNVGDYVELQGYQTSGGNLDTIASAEFASSMNVTWQRLAA